MQPFPTAILSLLLLGAAAPAAALTPEEEANIRVYETVNRSVVNITTSTVKYDIFGQPIMGKGVGSGAIIDKQGHIITNQHVIEDARTIRVTLTNDKSYTAELVGSDEEYDMAVLKINASPDELAPITLGRSEGLRIGQRAYALGNPFGFLQGTFTSGVVSSLNRSVPSRIGDRMMTGMIQTDAAMNPGNSGGPLLNSSGEMIGMCVAIISSTGQNAGVGFAIPADRIRRFLPDLIEQGRVVRAYHGIVMLNETSRGLRIARLSPGGPAEVAGLQPFKLKVRTWRDGNRIYREQTLDRDSADYLLAIDGVPVSSHTDFLKLMDGHKPGDRVVFTIERSGQRLDIAVTLGAA